MRIAILGTGRVAQTLAAGLLRAGHDVVFGSRDPGNRTGLPARVLASADAVVGADVVLNAVPGVDTIPLLASIGADNLDGAVLWDIANAANADFSLFDLGGIANAVRNDAARARNAQPQHHDRQGRIAGSGRARLRRPLEREASRHRPA
jgi:predicted dinucleotide-binding enzyme